MARWLALPIVAIVLLLPLGCLAFQDALLMHIQRNQDRLKSYQGVLVEKGVIPEGDLTSDSAFERPDKLMSRVKSPEFTRAPRSSRAATWWSSTGRRSATRFASTTSPT